MHCVKNIQRQENTGQKKLRTWTLFIQWWNAFITLLDFTETRLKVFKNVKNLYKKVYMECCWFFVENVIKIQIRYDQDYLTIFLKLRKEKKQIIKHACTRQFKSGSKVNKSYLFYRIFFTKSETKISNTQLYQIHTYMWSRKTVNWTLLFFIRFLFIPTNISIFIFIK